jgi:hypothetical protein
MFLQKNQQKIQTDFSRSVRGVQKHYEQYRGKKSDPGPFLASDPPIHMAAHCKTKKLQPASG